MRRFAFPKSRRLLSNSEFRNVLSRRLSARDEMLILYARENGLDYPRLGISMSKSYGNAVVRNRLKRLIREAFRQNQDVIPQGFDYVVSLPLRKGSQNDDKSAVKQTVSALKFEEIKNSLLTLATRLASRRA
jgi:ribonuclease P protein component